MEKPIDVFEGIKNKRLKNKMIFASLDGTLLDNCLD